MTRRFVTHHCACPDFGILTGNDYGKPEGIGLVKGIAAIRKARTLPGGTELRQGHLLPSDLVGLVAAVAGDQSPQKREVCQAVIEKAYYCFRAAVVADWATNTQLHLQEIDIPHHIVAFLGEIEHDAGCVWRDSVGEGKYSRFLYDAYPSFDIPPSLVVASQVGARTATEIACELRARGTVMPKTGGQDCRKSIALAMLHTEHISPLGAIIHYPELLRAGVALDEHEAALAGIHSAVDSKSQTAGSKKILQLADSQKWGPLGSTPGSWVADDAKLQFLMPELTDDVLEKWFCRSWSRPSKDFAPRALHKGAVNTAHRPVQLEYLDVPESELCIVRALIQHSFKNPGLLFTAVKVGTVVTVLRCA
jgi:hypothetical protein